MKNKNIQSIKQNGFMSGVFFTFLFTLLVSSIAYASFTPWNVGNLDGTTQNGDVVTSDDWDGLVNKINELAAAPSAPSVPSGAIMAFDLENCPEGWKAADGTNGTSDLRGTFIRGIGGDQNSRDVARTLGGYQGDEFKSHTHTANHNHTASTNSAGSHTHKLVDGATISGSSSYPSSLYYQNNNEEYYNPGISGFYSMPRYSNTNTSSAGAHSHTVTVNTKNVTTSSVGGTETRPKNIAFLYCIKD